MSYRSALSASFSGNSLPRLSYLQGHLGDNTSDAGTPVERCRRPTVAWPPTTTTASVTHPAAAAAADAESPDAAVMIAEETDEQQQQQQLTEPLLLPASPSKEAEAGAGVQHCRGSGLWLELRMVLVLALPTVVTSAAQQVIIITSQMFSGHIGTDELAAVALSNTWWNFCWYIILGVSTALDTLGSQAVGAGDKSRLVVWTISSSFVLSLITIPMSVRHSCFWAVMELSLPNLCSTYAQPMQPAVGGGRHAPAVSALKVCPTHTGQPARTALHGVSLWYGGDIAAWFFGQGPAVSALVSKYSRWMIPGLWPMTMAALLQKYLQVQGLVGPPAITSGISIVLNIACLVPGMLCVPQSRLAILGRSPGPSWPWASQVGSCWAWSAPRSRSRQPLPDTSDLRQWQRTRASSPSPPSATSRCLSRSPPPPPSASATSWGPGRLRRLPRAAGWWWCWGRRSWPCAARRSTS
ncbi:hypothetical protein COO60DRAFT_507012 [Scenedesmus sp. NREL 46B-D3]|nr:hypothetical protein COO60DRAFT_507012 [Scenedesmus sp. NREL 46B-D3]